MSTARKVRIVPKKQRNMDAEIDDEEMEEESEIDEEDDHEQLTDAQNDEIRKLKRLLKKAYMDARIATRNPHIYDLIYVWDKLKLEKSSGGPNSQKKAPKKSLARIMHLEEGWTAEGLVEWLAPADAPFPVCPQALPRQDNRALWMCLRWRYQIDALQSTAVFPVDLDTTWAGIKLKSQTFGKSNATEFSKKLALDISLHQHKFIGKKQDIWFRASCETLGWNISKNFFKDYLIVLFAVCVDPAMIANATESFGKQWFGTDRVQVKEALFNAVRTAIRDPEEIEYPKTLELFKFLFPEVVKKLAI